jgi:hypothetical protein
MARLIVDAVYGGQAAVDHALAEAEGGSSGGGVVTRERL